MHVIGITSPFGDGKKAEAEKEAEVRSRPVQRIHGRLATSNLGEPGVLEEKGVLGREAAFAWSVLPAGSCAWGVQGLGQGLLNE